MARTPGDCEVMKDGRCTSCTNKCPASDHVKGKWIYVTKTRRVKKTLTEVEGKYEQNKGEKKLSLLEKLEKQMNDLKEEKEKYEHITAEGEKKKSRENLEKVMKDLTEKKEKCEQNKAEGEKKLSLLEKLEKQMNDLTEEKTLQLEEAYRHVVRLEDIALNVLSLSTHVHLDFLIEKMEEEGDREKVQKLEEMRGRVDEGTRGALSYMRYKFDKLKIVAKVVKETAVGE